MLWTVDYLWAHELYLPIRSTFKLKNNYTFSLAFVSYQTFTTVIYFLVRIYNTANLIFLSFIRSLPLSQIGFVPIKFETKDTLNISDLSKILSNPEHGLKMCGIQL